MKKIRYIIVLLFLCVNAVLAQNIAFVDIQKIMNTSIKGKKLKNEIQDKVKFYQNKLNELDNRISEIEKQLASPVLSEEAKEKKKKELAELKAEGTKIQMEAEEELAKMKAKAERELILEIKRITESYAKKKNIDLVFIGGTIGGVVYHDKTIDITDEILKLFDQEQKN